MKFYSKLLLIFSITLFLVDSPVLAEEAIAHIKSTEPNGTVKGKIFFRDNYEGLRIIAEVEGLTPGKHGFHVHEFGSCEDGGKAAGGHYNPDGLNHGHVLKTSVFDAHPGDLGNLDADNSGKAKFDEEVLDLSLSEGLFNIAGRAIIIHEKEDNFGQPAGNAGARIGCGTIIIVKPEE